LIGTMSGHCLQLAETEIDHMAAAGQLKKI
jgi:hypothetical protein